MLNLESGGSAFYLGITGAQDYIDAGKCDGDIKGIEADDKTGKITINLDAPTARSRTCWRCGSSAWFRATRPART